LSFLRVSGGLYSFFVVGLGISSIATRALEIEYAETE